LLAFGRKQMLQPKLVDLNQVVERTEPLLRRLFAENLTLTKVLDPVLRPVKVDPGQMEHVLVNLTPNARDAMPDGGTLTLATGNFVLEDNQRAPCPDMEPGPYVYLTVSDTGCGMDEATRGRIFEPFFTTKEVGQGTGLGLATVYGIIKQSGGAI